MPAHFCGNDKEKIVLDAWIKISRARDSVGRAIRPSIEDNGLTVPQFAVLEILLHLGPQNQKSIGDKMLSSAGNIVKVIDNLVRDGLVVRTADPNDRRVHIIKLEKAGEKLINKVFAEHLTSLMEAFTVLEDEELLDLARLCKRLGLGKSAENNLKGEDNG